MAARKPGLAGGGPDGDRTPRAASSLRSSTPASTSRPVGTTPRVPQQAPAQPSSRAALGRERLGTGGIGSAEAAGASASDSRKRARTATGTGTGTGTGIVGPPPSSAPASGIRATFRTPAPIPRRASAESTLPASGSRGPRGAAGRPFLLGDAGRGKGEGGDAHGTPAPAGGGQLVSYATAAEEAEEEGAAAGGSPLHEGAGGGRQMVVGAAVRDSGAMVAADEGEVDEGEALDWDSVRCSYKCRNLVRVDLLRHLDAVERENKELRGLRAELTRTTTLAGEEVKRLQGRVASLEQALASSSRREAEREDLRRKDALRTEEMLRTQTSRAHDLQAKMHGEMRLRMEAEQASIAAEERALAVELQLERAREAAARAERAAGDAAAQAEQRHQMLASRNESELSAARQVENELREMIASLEREAAVAKQELMQTSKEKQELEREVQRQQAKEAGARDTRGDSLLVAALRTELNHMSALVVEARRVKATHESVAVLQEQLEGERRRAERAERAAEGGGQSEARAQHLQRELDAWCAAARQCIGGVPARAAGAPPGAAAQEEGAGEGSRDAVSGSGGKAQVLADTPLPSRLLQAFSSMHKAAIAATEREAKVVGDMAAARAAEASLVARVRLLEGGKEDLEAHIQSLKQEVKGLQSQMGVVAQERDTLSKILASYDQEEAEVIARTQALWQGQQQQPQQQQPQQQGAGAPTGDARGPAAGAEPGPAFTPEKSKQARLQELESLLEERGRQLVAKDAQLEQARAAAGASVQALTDLRRQLEREEEERRGEGGMGKGVGMAEAEVQALRRRVAELEEKVGRGDFNALATRVVHMRSNPEAWARQGWRPGEPLPKLAGPPGTGAGAGAGTGLGAGAAAGEDEVEGPGQASQSQGGGAEEEGALGGAAGERVARLKRKVADLERKEQRCRELAQNMIKEVREACYCLFGYKVQLGQPSSGGAAGGGGGQGETVFVVQSVFADEDDERMEFRRAAEGGGFELLSTPYTESPEMQRQVATFLKRFGSIPAFTANLTMELFNKHTLS